MNPTQSDILQINKRKKKIRVAYFLLFFFSWTGLHQLYLKNPLRCWAFILTQGAGVVCGVGSFTIGLSRAMGRGASYGNSPEALATEAFVDKWLMVGIVLTILGFFLWLQDAFTLPKQIDSADKKKWTAFQIFTILIMAILIIILIFFIVYFNIQLGVT